MTGNSAACARCGYDLAGLGEGVACPECGSIRRKTSMPRMTRRQIAGVVAHAFAPAALSLLIGLLLPAAWVSRISLYPTGYMLLFFVLVPGLALAHAGWMLAVTSVLIPARRGADVVIGIALALPVFVVDFVAFVLLATRFFSFAAGGP